MIMMNNYVLNIDLSENNLIEQKECLICLDIIENNDDNAVYILECCKNHVHLKCLYSWYTTHKNKKTCFICNQYNKLCHDISIPLRIDNSYTQLIDRENLQANQVAALRQQYNGLTRNQVVFFITTILIIATLVIIIPMTSQYIF